MDCIIKSTGIFHIFIGSQNYKGWHKFTGEIKNKILTVCQNQNQRLI